MQGSSLDNHLHKTAEDIIKRLKELETSKDWRENGVTPCYMYKMDIGERVACMGIDVVEFSLHKVVEFLEKEQSLKKIDSQLLEIKELYENKGFFKVLYQQYEGIWPVSNRDFVSVAILVREGDHKVYIGIKSCNYPHPEAEGVVRGQIFIGGYIIEKINQNKTKITYISDADPKGSIPGMIKNILSTRQGEVASKVGQIMKKQGY